MIALIGTFNTENVLAEFLDNNADLLSKRDAFIGCFSVNSESLINIEPSENVYIVCKKDKCYSEGWNNALNELFELNFQVKGLIFLGDGDVLNVPSGEIKWDDDSKVLIGGLVYNGIVQKNRLAPSYLRWLFLGVWTPSVIWPIDIFKEYRLPTEFKIASDVDLFFSQKRRLFNVSYTKSYYVEMDNKGISSANAGLSEYRKILSKYYPGILVSISHYLKIFKKHVLSSRSS